MDGGYRTAILDSIYNVVKNVVKSFVLYINLKNDYIIKIDYIC